MTKHEEKLKRAVEGTGIAEVIQTASNANEDPTPQINKVVVQARVPADEVPKWLTVLDFILQEEEEQDDEEQKWSAHCCKTYVRHEGKLGFVWSVSISSRGLLARPVSDVARAVRTIGASLKSVPEAEMRARNGSEQKNAFQRAAKAVASGRVTNAGREPTITWFGEKAEVVEMPLTGLTEDRNKPDGPNSKGARYIAGG